MVLKVQTFLRTNGSLERLKTLYAIKAVRSVKYPELVLLKYNQIDSPMDNPIVQECRGLILNESDDWAVVSYPFKKFFNYGEHHAAQIDWASARFQEKLDGSLIQLYFYKGKWCVATSGNPDAAGNVGDSNLTYADLFWRTWSILGYSTNRLPRSMTYLFELTSPENRVIIPHSTTRITLIGVRELWDSYYEVTPGYSVDWLPKATTFPISSLEDALESFKRLDGSRMEGYVVVDQYFNRVKVKHPGYVALHHMRDKIGSSDKSLVSIFLSGETSELTSYFPEYKAQLDLIKDKYNKLCVDMDEQYDIIYESCGNGKVNRKRFAEQAGKLPNSGYYFARLDDKIKSADEYWRSLPQKREEKIAEALKL